MDIDSFNWFNLSWHFPLVFLVFWSFCSVFQEIFLTFSCILRFIIYYFGIFNLHELFIVFLCSFLIIVSYCLNEYSIFSFRAQVGIPCSILYFMNDLYLCCLGQFFDIYFGYSHLNYRICYSSLVFQVSLQIKDKFDWYSWLGWGFLCPDPELELSFVFWGMNVNDRIHFRVLGAGGKVEPLRRCHSKVSPLWGFRPVLWIVIAWIHYILYLNFFRDNVSNLAWGQKSCGIAWQEQGTKDQQDSVLWLCPSWYVL